MKLISLMVDCELASSRGEAERLVKQGAVRIGGCEARCSFFETGKCTCGEWRKATSPTEDVKPGESVKVGSGFGRTTNGRFFHGVAKAAGQPGHVGFPLYSARGEFLRMLPISVEEVKQ